MRCMDGSEKGERRLIARGAKQEINTTEGRERRATQIIRIQLIFMWVRV
jgi:hypothetical protein